MSFDLEYAAHLKRTKSQSLWNRAMSFDFDTFVIIEVFVRSQSLWNRAMSFDQVRMQNQQKPLSLNPFGTGQCLST